MQEQTSTPVRGWTVVLAAVGVNLIIGALYAWSVMGKALVGQWHWTKTQAMLPFAASTASFAVTMIFAGRWQDKIGPRYVAMLGGIIFGLGWLLSSFVHTYVPMVITFGLIGGMGIGLGYSATTPPSIKWFPPAQERLDHRHRGQRGRPGRGVYVAPDQLPAQSHQHSADLSHPGHRQASCWSRSWPNS